MAKFIKFTNSRPYSVVNGRPLEVVDEIILSTDRICSLSQNGNEYRIVTYVDIINAEHMTVQHTTSYAIISKEDYENAKHILMGEAESAHVCNEHEEAVDIPHEFTTEDTERMSIKNALVASCGNRKVAAAKLCISERTLYRKIKEYDL